MNIDISNLGKPLTKLIEVIAAGVGNVSRSYLVRKNADAKAYEIKRISEAVSQNQTALSQLEYKDGEVKVIAQTEMAEEIDSSENDSQISARISYQETKKQENIEQITRQAAEEIGLSDTVSDDEVDDDWISRFFKISEDISSEEMQTLWGKILAGEVVKPGTYSLRTLDVLKNITKSDAETFAKVSQAVLISGDTTFLINIDNNKYLEKEFGITFSDFILMRELGLMLPTDLSYSLNPAEKDENVVFKYGPICIVIERTSGTPAQNVQAAVLSGIGSELVQLINIEPKQSYIQKVASCFRRDGVNVKFGEIIAVEAAGIRHKGLVEVPSEV